MRENPSPKTPAPSWLQGKRIVEMSGSKRKKRQTPAALINLKNGTGSIGEAISRPKQVGQWPLDFQEEIAPGRETNETFVPSSTAKRVAPKRPPRPSYVPSILDPTRSQALIPSSQGPPQTFVSDGKDIGSPSLHTSSSRPSSYTSSSVGTIPDFPIPSSNRLSQRNTAPLGSSSFARNSSIQYPQKSLISPIPPIPEEPLWSGKSDSAYASSAAIPIGWGTIESPDFDEVGNGYKRNQFSSHAPEKAKLHETRRWKELDRNTYEEDYADSSDYGDYDAENDEQQLNTTFRPPMENFRNTPKSSIKEIRLSGKGLQLENRLSRSSKSSFMGKKLRDPSATKYDDNDLPLASATESVSTKSERLDDSLLHPHDNLTPRSTVSPRNTIFARFTARQYPPARLEVDPSTDSRWSATSLPDLILRATRLASLIDRGKRPGSNTYVDNYCPEKDVENGNYEQDQVYSPQSDVSDIAARYSPGGLDKITKIDQYDSPTTNPSTKQSKNNPKKFCCLPYGAFMALLIFPIIIILAAIFVPLTLFVFMKQHPVTITSRADALNSCALSSLTSCQNGGTSILLEDNSCGCLCTNGFDGPTCTTSITSLGCINSTLSGTPESMGSSIERLIIGAKANFSIPLDARMIVSRFNTANMSCAAENSLVTFNGKSAREEMPKPDTALEGVTLRRIRNNVDPTLNSKIKLMSDSSLDLRNIPPDSVVTQSPVARSTPTPTMIPSSTSSVLEPAPMDTSYPSNPPKFLPNEVTLDFARVATLFILQETSLNEAINAQSSFQRFFNGLSFLADSAQNFTLSKSVKQITVNLVTGSLDLGSGKGVVGGKGGRRDTLNEPRLKHTRDDG